MHGTNIKIYPFVEWFEDGDGSWSSYWDFSLAPFEYEVSAVSFDGDVRVACLVLIDGKVTEGHYYNSSKVQRALYKCVCVYIYMYIYI